MITQKKYRRVFDLAGIAFSFLCVIHCLAFPFIMFFIPTYAMTYLQSGIPGNDAIVHRILFYLVFMSAGLAFVPGYFYHKKLFPLCFSLLGITLVFFSAFFAHNMIGHEKEPYLSIVGSVFLIFAHLLNHNLSHRYCNHCKGHKHD